MLGKFHNKYRIPSTRLQKWDYRWAGAYYITICTKNRKHYFGEIENKRMKFSPVGIIADIMWHEIKNHDRKIKLDEFVVMPNHIHGILILDGNDMDHDHGNGGMMGDNAGNVGDAGNTGNNDYPHDPVETLHATSLRSTPQPSTPSTPQPSTPSTPQPSTRSPHQPSPTSTQSLLQIQSISQSPSIQSIKNEFMASIAPKSYSISTIIRSYKSAVTKHAHRLGFDFEWQTRFYDHIVRDVNDFIRIQTYIIENPEKWVNDSFYAHK